METFSEIKVENVSSDCEYGVCRTSVSPSYSDVRMINLNLKDELKLKILERRKKEGKTEIKMEEVINQEPKHYPVRSVKIVHV